ncbi:MAG: hypothetical protein COZ99_03795 [Parcubacteria group bacterium CG_4_8_14_3_um_filter_48_16]|nr:MAG: hypothetical protein COZ99_03795 [Parcubacteria group bacterium CG_4_8_14_3_um_filter_48_16]PIY78163.1 MAG: hypothetical protein COY83_01235 [Parcubacteria group bacterium CG_4_10_14_0_8_um_filter_48_154]PJC39412.1 MAG: hypothetical protein CO043_04250 [Parcubacteria group bacterium CG_4_9_14_0_2_um_filter_48_40]
MYIAHITPVFPPYKGGMGMVAKEMAAGLARRGHTVDVLTPEYVRGLPEEDYPEGMRVTRVRPLWKRGNAAFIPQLFGMLGKYDVLHVHYPFFGGAEASWLYTMTDKKKPYILTYHMDTAGFGVRQKLFSFYRAFLLPQYLWSSHAITVSSYDYAKKSFVAEIFKKKPEKFFEIPFGVNEVFFEEGEAQKESQPTILFVGGLDTAHYFKGLQNLLDAVVKLRIPNAKLWIVGDGDLRQHYEKQAEDLGIERWVQFLGSLATHDLAARYRSAWITVLPSLDVSEAFGIVLAESQACGTPVIASDLPGVRTVFVPGKTGLAVRHGNVDELAERITQLLTDRELRENMGKEALAYAHTRFHWGSIVKDIEYIYQQVLKSL